MEFDIEQMEISEFVLRSPAIRAQNMLRDEDDQDKVEEYENISDKLQINCLFKKDAKKKL